MNTVINGKNVPISGYPTASPSYWTVDGTATGASKTFDNAIECAGFSKYVYNYIWGSTTYGRKIPARDCVGNSNDFYNISIGARINCTGPNGNHSMVLIGMTINDVTVYDANWKNYNTENCRVDQRTYTFAEFAGIFSSINSGYCR